MKNLLYIGNNLKSIKSNPSSIQVLGKLFENEGYKLRYASSYTNKFFRILHMLWSCMRYSKWADYVVIDTYSTQNFYYALCCSQICRLLGIDYVPILHGGNLPNRLASNPRFSRMIFKHSKKNIAPSLYIKNAFETAGFSNIEFIPNSIEINNYQVIAKDFNSIRLLWVRSFSKIYNPQMAIDVLKEVLDLGYKVSLCMVGPDSDGSLTHLKEKANTENLDVKFTGKLSKPEWITLSKNYNIFINTTNYDNLPVSLIEAMALGFPIVSTNVGGLAFLISHCENGLLVDKNDTEAMGKCIVELFNNKELRNKLSIDARAKAETFDWKHTKNKWHKIFEE
ncbi:MAG: glycosyltransferase [Winogradskyella sp.]|uniref:glycosyltransferase family 4 protein n=1 Tax=Winogradskyella sp. TaxID=1883156 RepID=UPI000F401326|nr:glycosyltransferase family 4 protein [Winogradskyella sp.]RNC86897.1 MAG: glycosyltransferase [Winogradskyella sp.]